jgi:hypothetical protein
MLVMVVSATLIPPVNLSHLFYEASLVKSSQKQVNRLADAIDKVWNMEQVVVRKY